MLIKHLNNKNGTIAVVGNSEPTIDHSDAIDSADYVIRFSNVMHFDTGLIGTRTDAITLRSQVMIKDKYIDKLKKTKNTRPFKDCKEILCVGLKKNISEENLSIFTKEVQELKHKLVTIVLINRLYQYVVGEYHNEDIRNCLTNGVTVLLYILNNMPQNQSHNTKIKLFCFNYTEFDLNNIRAWTVLEKQFCHSFAKEAKLITDLAEQGFIELYN